MSAARITLVPHTHWDREWYEPFDRFLERLVEMMDTLVELADEGFPHFHLDGQTAMIDDYLAVRPERAEDIARLVRQGRLSAGPWVTQTDEFLTSGESHVRNLEMGLARAGELGRPLLVGYLPDQFGHVGQMPQILRAAGLHRAVVWRGVPAAVDRTSFWWEAPDGSRVLAEYLAFGYFLGGDLHRLTDPAELSEALRRKVEHVEPFLASDRVLIMVGSDHAGPDPTLPDRVASAQVPGVEVTVASLERHLDGAVPQGLPTWRGELRSSARAHLLPNVYSARVHQKRERGRLEALLERYAEPLAALVPGSTWPADELDRAWTLMLWNGAHDSVCGCSHDGVARDVDARYDEVRTIAQAIVERSLERLARSVEGSGTLRFNPSPFERNGVPGLGWRVDREPVGLAEDPVPLRAEDGWIRADELAFRLRDEEDMGDLYTFCPAPSGEGASDPLELVAREGRVRATFEDLTVELSVSRRAGEPFIRLSGLIDNRRPDHRLRLHVRLPAVAEGSVAGSPFELVPRARRSEGGEPEPPSPTWPARHLVLAAGVAAYHEGVFEYEAADRELVITLLRCVGTISRSYLATRSFAAGPEVPTPEAQMLGRTGFALALQADASLEGVLEAWERFALPLVLAPAAEGGELPSSGTLLDLEGDCELSNVRRWQGALEVRLWNPRRQDPATCRVAGVEHRLGPARIETIRPG
ncbi:MAG TPA: hypothetical protein VE646_10175 [Actinomycetota bacterium]|nr:hypothetical protein [Actinomycetota bacterium]